MFLFTEEEAPEAPPEVKKVLKVKAVDLQIAKNATDHHTDSYELVNPDGERDEETGKELPQVLVLRRGQSVTMQVKFNRNYDKDTDDIKLAMEYECK